MSPNALNFSAGPGALPEPVLRAAREAIVALPETGLSVLGMSHRSAWFAAVFEEAEANLRQLLGAPSDYTVLFMQGGSSLQFAIAPLSFSSAERPASYVVSGYWSAKAFHEASRIAAATVVWNGEPRGYSDIPSLADLNLAAHRSSYLHYVSNETVEGVQFPALDRKLNLPVICDMSSDFLSRPVHVPDYDLIYAHSQKNLGPAGITVVAMSPELLSRVPAGLPSMLDYTVHARHKSNYNTPPVFTIYVLLLITRWLLRDIGGIEAIHAINRRKAEKLYQTLARFEDEIAIHAAPACRSMMNVSFRFRDTRREPDFLRQAQANGFSGLEGHRSLKGIRVSLYNAITEDAVGALCSFIEDFFSRTSSPVPPE